MIANKETVEMQLYEALGRGMSPPDLERPTHNPSNGATIDAAAPSHGILPDIAQDGVAEVAGRLDRVGMSGVELVLRIPAPRSDTASPPLMAVVGRGDVFVSLDDPHAKGIHMSRLFLRLQRLLEDNPFGPELIERALVDFVQSHAGLSRDSFLRVQYALPIHRRALISGHGGWRVYPVTLSGELRDGVQRLSLRVKVTYSSTCPCSAALARQLIQQRFTEDFAGRTELRADEVAAWLGTKEAICATPHSQRSFAEVELVCLRGGDLPPPDHLVDLIEQAVETPVQAAVKRADEQHFARINGENLMFCEDAARRIRAVVDRLPAIDDYRIEASHIESLHPHDAVAVVTKGRPGGLRP